MLIGFDELTVLRGSKFYGTWQWTNKDSGTPEDFTGLTATIKIKNIHEDFEDVKNVYEIGTAIVEPLDQDGNIIKGRIDIELSKEDTLKFAIPEDEEDEYETSDFYSVLTVTLSNQEVALQAKVRVVESLESETLNFLMDEKDEAIIINQKLDEFLASNEEFITQRDSYLQTLATAQNEVDSNLSIVLDKHDEVTQMKNEVSNIKDIVETIYDNFDDRYLGKKSIEPTLDNDGNALVIGQMYYNTVELSLNFYDGNNWVDYFEIAKNYADQASLSEENTLNYKNEALSAKDTAVSSASTATTKATEANQSVVDAANILTQVEIIFDNFDDKHLGSKANDPTLDNDGEPLKNGASYWNTTVGELRFYNASTWDSPSASAYNSALSAASSASNAGASANDAIQSASNASQSEANAAISEANSLTSEQNALEHKNQSEIFRNEAELFKNAVNPELLNNFTYPFNGYRSKPDFMFIGDSKFTYKTAVKGDYFKINGKVVGILGEELIDNSDFSNGTTGWSNLYSASVFNATNKYLETNGWATYTIMLQANRLYAFTYDAECLSALYGIVRIGYSNESSELYANNSVGVQKRYKTTILTTSTTTLKISVLGRTDGYLKLDNISIREIKTIDMSSGNNRTGFLGQGDNSFIPHVEVQDKATNGLVVQGKVKKGDYVVVDTEELVTNGTFDSDVNGWSTNYGTVTPYNGKARIQSTTDYTLLSNTPYVIEAGKMYNVTIEVTVTSGQFYVSFGSNTITSTTYESASQTVSGTFVADSSEMLSFFGRVFNGVPIDIEVDNISVQLVDDTYRATRDTADMYDIEVTEGQTNVSYNTGVIYKNLTDGLYYKYNGVNTGTWTVPDLSSNTSWQELGTADNMSLLNPYFKTRDYISNQVASVLLEDGSIHNEILLNDVFAKDRYKALELNGWSKLENGLYSKGLMVGTVVSIWQTLNKGAYIEGLNKFGTAVKGNNFPNDATSISDCFVGQNGGDIVSGFSGRPDGKFYDIMYKDQLIDITTSCTEDTESVQEVRNKLVSEDGVSDGGTNPILSAGTKLQAEELDGISQAVWDLSFKAIEILQVLKSTDGGTTWSSISFTANYISNQITIAASDKILVSYTSKNPTLEESEPIEIIEVDSQVLASNSHSIYKYNTMIDGKIQVGNGSNGLESQLVWNTVLDENSTIQTIPTHTTIQLDNSNSPAYKHLIAKGLDSDGMVHDVVISQELEFNTGTNSYDLDDGTFDLSTAKFSTRPTGRFRR